MRHITLALCTLLHAFTHAFHAVLIPLYLLMQADLNRPGVRSIALIVSAYNFVYFLLSYPAGILADHSNRRMLLGLGLVGNSLAFVLMAMTHQYGVILLLGLMAGLFGTLYHPAANALVPAHYPRHPGMVIGIMGMGSGVGFFVGSQYAGWRADTVAQTLWPMASWQAPCAELGLVGIAAGLAFLLLAREVPHAAARRPRTPMGKGMRRRVLAVAAVLGWRDFAGVATSTLVSIYLQKAHGYTLKQTGWILGAMGLLSVIVTPLGVWVTGRGRRLPGLAMVLICGAAVLATVPHVPRAGILPILALYQIFLLGSFAVGEVAVVELVDRAIRGRAVGLLLTVSGTLGSIAPYIVGAWVDTLGQAAMKPSGYYMPFAVLAGLMAFSSLATRLMPRLRRPTPTLEPPPA